MTLAKTITHKYTKEQVTFLKSGSETKGELLHIEVSLPPNGDGPPLHCHDEFEERFEVISGQLTVFVGDQKLVLQPGEVANAKIGIPHTFTNEHDEPVTFQVKLTPASQFEKSMRIHYGLMDDGLTNGQGVPKNLLHLALILHLQNTYVAEKSLKMQRVLFKTLVILGKLTGSYKKLAKYYQ